MADSDEKLSEENFVQEERGNPKLPPWLLVVIFLGIAALMLAIGNWFFYSIQGNVEKGPFLQVTNREMSLFLWQNPEYMRGVRTIKTGYLPGFYSEGKANPRLESVDEYVSAPPDVLFQYHTWNRLLGSYVIPRPISKDEFVEFLRSCPEWSAEHWSKAPKGYQDLLASLDHAEEGDLEGLPRDVKIAFFGWKNYYREGGLINHTQMNVEDATAFLRDYPNYDRNYWRNLLPDYLSLLLSDHLSAKLIILGKERPSFLRAAFYNWKQIQQSKEKTKPLNPQAE